MKFKRRKMFERFLQLSIRTQNFTIYESSMIWLNKLAQNRGFLKQRFTIVLYERKTTTGTPSKPAQSFQTRSTGKVAILFFFF